MPVHVAAAPGVAPLARASRAIALAALLPLGCGGDRPPPPIADLAAIAVPAAPGSAEPHLAVGPTGQAYLSWLEPAAAGFRALRVSLLGDSGWQEPTSISAGPGWFVNWADVPSVAVGESVAVAHWLVSRGRTGEAHDVRIARSYDGGLYWGAPTSPYTDDSDAERGFVTLLPGRGVLVDVVWLDGRGHPAADRARRAGDSTPPRETSLRVATLGPPNRVFDERVLDDRVCDCCQTSAVLIDGHAVVAYRDRSPDEIRDIAVVRQLEDGSWSRPVPVARDGWRIAACPVNGPAIAAAGRRVAVAWFTAAGDAKRVFAAFSTDGAASFGRRVRVDDGRPVGRVDAVMEDDGSALVSWLEEVAGGAEIRVRRVAADSTVSASVTVARSVAGRPAGFPRMARSGDRVFFAWTEPADSGTSRVHTAAARLVQERR